ncbi:kalirin-like [Ostrinia furnacalis]|uniref:kalirin-like n=1 Tax=Ostrinia furnacalis TaxID=93504 RepID=UPI001040BDB6|nr:kalirin-like [Ostrinia furnacalis]
MKYWFCSQLANPDPPIPEGLRDRRHRMIFGNIEVIYEWHRDKFVHELHECVAAPELLGPLFHRFFEKRMFMYEQYCRNKPVSEYIVSEHDHFFQELRHKLGHKLQLGDLLIKPIQRIQKYHLLVKKILSYSEHARANPDVLASLRQAMHYTDIIPKNANMMMDVGRLQGFTGNITAQGKLLMQEALQVADLSSSSEKGKELHVFLFEQCVIFSEAVGKKNQYTSPTYNYKGHVQMNKMELEEVENNTAFIIHSLDPNKPRQSYLCKGPEASLQEWIAALSRILNSQRMFGEALENPSAYLRELQGHSSAGSGWCGLRKTESVPPSVGARLAPELRRTQRPHAKANTINLPTTAIRGDERKKSANVAANNAAAHTSPPHANGLSKRPWGLKLRRGGSGGAGEPSAEGVVTELRPPELSEPATDVTVSPGASATLSCRAGAARAAASWRKTAPETRALRHGDRFAISLAPDGLATLTIHACRASDAGVYCCLISNELGGVQTSARLTVGAGGAPGVPAVRAHPGGGLVVQWDESSPAHLEYCRVGEGEWRRATETPAAANTLALEELPAGQYSFRLVCARSGAPGAASGPAACGGGGSWQREQFGRRYSIEEEIGRGRTARVLAARDTGTGQRVALKQVLAGRGADATREYRMLSQCAHGGVVRAMALFADVPRAGAHTLVLELVGGGPLLDWAQAHPALYTQQAAAQHTRQLLSALDYLHGNNIAHLDVRPENILVELGGAAPQVKLIDLGCAAEGAAGAGGAGRDVLPPAPAQLEFAPPECVLGRPPAPAWDAWAAGVFLYVFLTGVYLHWGGVSERAQQLIRGLLEPAPAARLPLRDALADPWFDECLTEARRRFPPGHWGGVSERAQQLIRGLLEPAPAARLPLRDALADPWFDECLTEARRRFPPGHWGGVSERAQQLIRGLLEPAPAARLPLRDALADPWFDEAPPTPLSATQLKTFLDRRRPAGHGNALHSLRSPDT